ncbi:MAG: helix-turn-helix transcriptional regulator [Planctomycetota bacterium]
MMTTQHIQSEHLRKVAEVVSSVGSLPAVATQDWCETACRAINALRPDALVCLMIADLAENGEILLMEAIGAVHGGYNGEMVDGAMLHPASASSLGWWLEGHPGRTQASRTTLLRMNPAASRWSETVVGRRWTQEFGMSDMLVGLTPIGVEDDGRCIVIEMGVRADDEEFAAPDAAALQAILPQLAHRAELAFGAEPINPMNRITPREQLILEQLALGKTVKQIATGLSRSPHTIHDHVKSLHRKLNASSRGELIARALGHIESCGGHDTRPLPAIHTRPHVLPQTA